MDVTLEHKKKHLSINGTYENLDKTVINLGVKKLIILENDFKNITGSLAGVEEIFKSLQKAGVQVKGTNLA